MAAANKFRVYSRFVRFTFFTFGIVVRVYVNSWRKSPLQKGLRIRQQWAKGTISGIYNFEEESRGQIPSGQHLFVSNHRASIDPIVYLQYVKAFPVSRADVEHYPLVGRGAKTVGTIFVNKTNRSSRAATILAMESEFENGNSVLLFPEGRTHAEETTVRFHIGSFRAASAKNVPVLPMAIDYLDQHDYWTHEDPFIVHFNKQFGPRKKTCIMIRFGESIPPGPPEEMLEKAQAWINEQIIDMRQEWNGRQIMREKEVLKESEI